MGRASPQVLALLFNTMKFLQPEDITSPTSCIAFILGTTTPWRKTITHAWVNDFGQNRFTDESSIFDRATLAEELDWKDGVAKSPTLPILYQDTDGLMFRYDGTASPTKISDSEYEFVRQAWAEIDHHKMNTSL